MFNSLWYKNLIKPVLTPPNQVFAPVWSFLYLTIFLALILFLFNEDENKKLGLIYFSIQMILNISWVFIFFGLKSILLSLFVVILIDIFLILTIKEFYAVSKISGIILIPYLLWTLFATYLNYGYLILNG